MSASSEDGTSVNPPGSPQANLQRRRVQLRALLIFTSAAWGVYVVINLALARPYSAGVDAIASIAALLAALILARAPLSWLRGIEHANLLISTLALVVTGALSDGLGGQALWYLAAIPVFAAYQMDIRATFLWSFLSIVGAVAVSMGAIPLPVEFVPDDAERTFGLAFLILATGSIAMISRRILDQHAASLEAALSDVERLRGLLPICAGCKSIRDDKGYWHVVESYLEAHAHVEFTHGLCPGCVEKYYSRTEDSGDQEVAES